MSSIWSAVLVLSTLSAVFGALLGYASHRFKVEKDPIVEKINAVLPQSQCGQCGYPGCRPYADAVGNNGEMINKCVPGGEQTMLKLATILNVDPLPLWVESDLEYERKVAWIDEANCIGCTKCIQVCPVDAIVGLTHAMHTVLSDVCTGCKLCVAPCPTDCIKMHPVVNMTTRGKWDLQTIPVQVTIVENHA